MRADLHPDEIKRLEALCSYNIVGSERERQYDDLVNLAAGICDTPVALVSLVEEDRQWFKATTGLQLVETPIVNSVCSHAILSEGVTEIHDTSRDPRTADNALLHGSETPLLFYAGAPLLSAEGLPLGTLCVLDTRPRSLSEFQRTALTTLAGQVVKQMELRRALKNEEVLRAEMDHRIKNSLQSTSSMIRLYTRAVETESARDALLAVQRRIDSMTALHAQLQKSGDTGRVEMKSYLDELMTSLRVTTPEAITLTHECDDISLPFNNATDVGIIVSEFIANSIKHGFAGDASGDVFISLTQTADDKLVLQALDTGSGSDGPQFVQSTVSGIGNSIVAAAASNLDGELSNDLGPSGARMMLVFAPR